MEEWNFCFFIVSIIFIQRVLAHPLIISHIWKITWTVTYCTWYFRLLLILYFFLIISLIPIRLLSSINLTYSMLPLRLFLILMFSFSLWWIYASLVTRANSSWVISVFAVALKIIFPMASSLLIANETIFLTIFQIKH